ncbi:MAG: AAA family ATPase [Acidimicrobiales bacterium]
MTPRDADPWPIQANPGGPVDPGDHIGHEAEVEQVLRSIAGVGSLVIGDRRMGKTSLLRKVQQILVPEHVVLRISAETDDIELFARRLLDVLREDSRFADELERWDLDVDVSFRGIRLRRRGGDASQQPDGDTDDLFRWAAARAAPGRLVVILDEIAVLAGAIERDRPGGAVEFLRSLRRPRQELDNVAIVLAGSVGLHHAIPDNAPVNDLHKVRIGPLAIDDAVFLARCLILGEELAVSDAGAVAQAMADASDSIPYFIHHLAGVAGRSRDILEPAGVVSLRDAALADPDDPWNLRHYRDRLPLYYSDRHTLAGHILDAYATADQPLDVPGVMAWLAAVDLDERPSRDDLLRLVEQLESDHYLRRTGQSDTFASRILRDAWRQMRRI